MDDAPNDATPTPGRTGARPGAWGKPRDPERIDRVLELVREIWTRQPDSRLLQLLINAAPRGSEPTPHLYNFEDDLLEDRLREIYGIEPQAGSPRP